MERATRLVRLVALVAALLALAVSAATAQAAESAPKVTKQPAATTVEEGQPATFESTASGTPVPTVQWEVSTNGGTSYAQIEGATSTKFTIASTKTTESGNKFRAVFKNTLGTVTSNAATLTVRKAPVITKQPQGATVEEGQSAVFEAAATGSPAPTVAWELSSDGGSTWGPVTGGTSPTLTVAKTQTSFSGRLYRATFKNVAGTATTESALLIVRKAPSVTKQPAATTVEQGQTATFEATGSGFPSPTEQWEVSSDSGAHWTPIEGANATQLVIESTTVAQSGNLYRAVFTNAAGSAFSTAAKLTVVVPPPVITEQPQSTTVQAGEPATFEAAASSFETPTVQWEISTNGGTTWSTVSGATSAQLTIAVTQLTENGHQYRAKFTNSGGSTTTAVATLTVASNHYSAVAWGLNTDRQLGDGSFEAFRDVPVGVVGLKFVTAVSAGGVHSLALLANGKVDAWGSDEFGQLGDGGELDSNVPVEVSGLSGVKAIAAGGDHSLALLSNGTVMAWGDNEDGQLGTGTLIGSNVPVAVKNLTGVKAIAAGGAFSLALLNNGTVMAWGDNEHGQLGTGTVKQSSVPVAVKALTGVTAISAGGEFGLALLSGGTVKAWGNDDAGQLANERAGEGEEPFSDVPVAVESLTGATAIAAGKNHALALLSNGTAMAWGDDSAGELGNGVIESHSATPVAVSGLSNVDAVTAGGQLSGALVDGGEIMTWGINKWGTLGNGTTGSPSDVPVAVTSIAKAASVSAGGSHMLAFGEPLPTVTGLSPNAGPVAGGTTVTISGANLGEATAVTFGTTAATSFTVTSATTIEAVAPAGTGKVHVVVTTPAGTSGSTNASQYTYVNPPTIASLTPKTGTTEGGTSVTIKGTEFATASSVTIGGTSVPFTIVSGTELRTTTPAHAAGFVDAVVTNAGGTSAITTKDRYKYLPIIESVVPNEGPAAGGTSVTVTGTGFALGSTATTFKFGTGKATSVSCTSSTTCTMLSPAGTAGVTVDVTATVNKAVSLKSAADKFSYH